MKPYPDCIHHDCWARGQKLSRPHERIVNAACALVALALFVSVVLVWDVIGLYDSSPSVVAIAMSILLAPVLISSIATLTSSQFRKACKGSGSLHLACFTTLILVSSVYLISDYTDQIAAASDPRAVFNRYWWAGIAVLTGPVAASSLMFVVVRVADQAEVDRQQQLVDSCPNSREVETATAS